MGANIGDPVAQLSTAVRGLEDVVKVSSVYRSEPVGFQDQPEFFNLVCLVQSSCSPAEILTTTREAERTLGRTRSTRNAPRTIDIDILAYDEFVLETPELVIPHPRLHLRAFVLVPLSEIAPDWRHPVLGQTALEILDSAGPLERIERWGKLPLP